MPARRVETRDSPILSLRWRRDLSQDELAQKAGIPKRTLKRTLERIERGEVKNPRVRQLVAIAGALGAPLRDVLPADVRGDYDRLPSDPN